MGARAFAYTPGAYPESPGIYKMLSEKRKVLYIGKALNLRKRLSQYFQNKRHDGRYQLDLLLSQVSKVEVIATRDERDALVLENQLIKIEKPKYNIRLRDDKTYPYIRISKDTFPRVELSRETHDPDYETYGPFPAVASASRLVELLSLWYGIRRCPGVPMKELDRPCLYAQIGQCSAPCVRKINAEDYDKSLKQAVQILLGNTSKAIGNARSEMEKASKALQYEVAAHWRDVMQALQSFEKKSLSENAKYQELDAMACTHVRGWIMIAVLQIRDGVLRNSELFQERAFSDWKGLLSTFLLEYYGHREVPKMIVVSEAFDEQVLVQDILSERSERKIAVKIPERGELRNWIVMAMQNARAEMSCREATGKLGGDEEYLDMVKGELTLPRSPKLAIALDASIFGTEEPVGSVVVFEQGKANKKKYRHFKMKRRRESGEETRGDVYDIEEILSRYLGRLSKDERPDLILIDGGQVQLKSAAKVLKELGIPCDRGLMAISKGPARKSGDELIHVYGDTHPYDLKDLPLSMPLWTEMRDEAHRFALRLNRKRTQNTRLRSPFKAIPGIGPKSALVLAKHFASFDDLLYADPAKIEALEGLPSRQKTILLNMLQAHRDS